jgi:hypothetical protein
MTANKLCLGQIEALFDPFYAHIHPIEPVRQAGILILQRTDALLDLTDIMPHVIKRAANMAQMLQDKALGFGHQLTCWVSLAPPAMAVNRGDGHQ